MVFFGWWEKEKKKSNKEEGKERKRGRKGKIKLNVLSSWLIVTNCQSDDSVYYHCYNYYWYI